MGNYPISYNTRKEVRTMPRHDGTGPMGHGPLTGRGMGPCACAHGFPGPHARRGVGPGPHGRKGRGRGFWYTGMCDALPPEQTVEDLEQEKRMIEQELEDIQQAITDLKSEK